MLVGFPCERWKCVPPAQAAREGGGTEGWLKGTRKASELLQPPESRRAHCTRWTERCVARAYRRLRGSTDDAALRTLCSCRAGRLLWRQCRVGGRVCERLRCGVVDLRILRWLLLLL